METEITVSHQQREDIMNLIIFFQGLTVRVQQKIYCY